MKKIINKSINFIKNNPSLIFSLALIIFIPVAIFINSYYTLSYFQKNIDRILQSEAVVIEDVLGTLIGDTINQQNELQEKIKQLEKTKPQITNLEILVPENNNFRVVASFKENEINQIKKNKNENDFLNQSLNSESGFASLKELEGIRTWEVLKAIPNNEGEKIALAKISLSLAEADGLVKRTISISYWLLFITIVIVLLLIANHTRLFTYAILLEKLKEVDKMKDDFVSMASHELRTPLTALRGQLEFLKDRNKDKIDERGKQDINNMENSVERLNNLVNDILEVSRIQQGRIPFSFEKIEPSSIIETAVNELKQEAVQKGLQLNYEKKLLPQISVDKERLKQIIVNLIGNAIHYTKQGKVEVLTKSDDDKVYIAVTDTGVGISAEEQKKLFQKFYRIKNKETREITGTGLGLWISQQFAQKMKGNISVESIEGVGSHFTLELPVAK